MSLGTDKTDEPGRGGVPPTDRKLIAAAGVCLAIPIVALMAVPTYAREDPELFGFPFFFWYQLIWVFLCSGFTWMAYKLVLAARRPRGKGDR
jgi:hypothetical protein